jgi:pilus assembly protein CpaE
MSAALSDAMGGMSSGNLAGFLTADSPGTDALSIAVISPDAQRRNAAVNALDNCRNGRIREFISYTPGIGEVARMLRQDFDVVIIDLDSDPVYALDMVERICVEGQTTVMVYSAKTDPDLLMRCMRAGAREFLPLPIAQSVMGEALLRALARRPVLNAERSAGPSLLQRTQGSLHVFLSAKGGSGVTTLASNFAVSLAEESGQRTLLIDLNLPLGDAALDLGIKAQFSTVNALENSSRLDPHYLSTLLVRHSSGLLVLAAPSEMIPMQFPEGAIGRLLEIARQEFKYVVVDAGSRLEPQRMFPLNESSILYLVTQVGIPELRNSNRLIKQLAFDGGPRLEIVINRFDAGSLGIAEAHIDKALTRPAQWKVPNDYTAVRRMQSSATPLTHEDSPIARTIRQMTRTACGQPAVAQKKKTFGFF